MVLISIENISHQCPHHITQLMPKLPSLRPQVPAAGARDPKIAQSRSQRVQKVLSPARNGLPRVSCTIATLFCTSATLFCASEAGLWPTCTKHLLHPLLTTLGNFEISGPCSRHLGSQPHHITQLMLKVERVCRL